MQNISRKVLSPRIGVLLQRLMVMQRSNYSAVNDSVSHDDGFHKIPMGQSDLGEQTRLSFQSKDMKESGKTGVASVSADGFRLLDGSFMFGPIAVFPKTVLSWRVFSPDEITERSLELFFLLQPKLDCLVVGAGDQADVDKVRKNLAGLISKGSLGFEVMDTEHAISTFNFLNAEGRYVAAALFPPTHLSISEAQHGRSMDKVRSSLDVGESYLFDIDVKTDGIAQLCGRVFGKNTKEASEMEKKIRRIQGERAETAESDMILKDEDRLQELEERRSEVNKLKEEFKKKIGDK
uniref:NADH dehydrogenase [ubiquinone] 1 alpha subcomplex assembly factor 3 n=1 Tax=Ditylenchus dipsaci TaxID=166011 RepID=A0A915CMA6_9BILA